MKRKSGDRTVPVEEFHRECARVVAQIKTAGDVSWSAVPSRASQRGECRAESRVDFRDAILVARRD